jgi:hypothetical protein
MPNARLSIGRLVRGPAPTRDKKKRGSQLGGGGGRLPRGEVHRDVWGEGGQPLCYVYATFVRRTSPHSKSGANSLTRSFEWLRALPRGCTCKSGI